MTTPQALKAAGTLAHGCTLCFWYSPWAAGAIMGMVLTQDMGDRCLENNLKVIDKSDVYIPWVTENHFQIVNSLGLN